MHPREKRIAELQAMIESAKAEIKAIQAEAQIEKAEDAKPIEESSTDSIDESKEESEK